MRVHLITIGSSIADDLDVATMLREEGHVLVGDIESADVVAVWNPKNRPLYVVNASRPAPTICYSLHALKIFLSSAKDRRA